jgi:hypothetical protein
MPVRPHCDETEDAIMRNQATSELQARAAEALREVLEQVSTIKVRDLKLTQKAPGWSIVAHIKVLGRDHRLTCKVEASGELPQVGTALAELHADAAHLCADATPVLIFPNLSAEAQALCKESHACFLDLEGNARLMIGEVFIVKRSLPVRDFQQSSLALTQRRFAGALAGFPPARAVNPSGGRLMPACGA